MRWDVFCKVIDNHGDLGVCWRLSSQLAAGGDSVRLWVDDASALAWMAPHGLPGVDVLPWDAASAAEAADAVVEAFACDPPPAFVAALARKARAAGAQPPWINLEYLCAESWVERVHGLPSPVSTGPGRGLVKHFFHPGFTPATGGLLREPDLPARLAAFSRDGWLRERGIPVEAGGRLVSLFCYEPPGLHALLGSLAAAAAPTSLLVTAGRAQAAVDGWLQAHAPGRLRIHRLPHLPQTEFDHLLWSCDFNFVRGEDSLVRALWAGKPFAWNIYPQDDGVHLAKLDAFLDWLQAPPGLRELHHAWNAGQPATPPSLDLPGWTAVVQRARERLLAQPDLASQLKGFALRLQTGR